MNILDWGLIDYEEALNKQLELVELVAEEKTPDTLIFCTHPAVVTLGRATQPGDVFGWQGPVREISRGGRATYHGPSQLVVYPILNLKNARAHRPAKDIGHYLRSLEQAIVDTLKDFGVEAQGRSLQQKNGDEAPAEETGVWVDRQKIASLGIGVRKWVTYHGAAINLTEDTQAFTGMRPCGFSQDVMTNLERLIQAPPDRRRFQEKLRERLILGLG
jgi:lipoyl(octanoyl) transferase